MRKPTTRLNYDPIASTYDRRYRENRLPGVSAALTDLVQIYPRRPVLEAGCGTGHWLAGLNGEQNPIWGLDYSSGMLSQAQKQVPGARLGRATAAQLPYANDSFGVIFCVNALHHFDQPQAFINEAWRALQPGGSLAIIGQVPQNRLNRWYVYEYFEGTYEHDLARFPTWGQVLEWAITAGFKQVDWQAVEWIHDPKIGRAVFQDPFLQKEAVSQLALLSQNEYEAGLARIAAALTAAEQRQQELEFGCDLRLDMLLARK